MMIDPEYHAFGPWILEVTPQHPLPPLFEPYYKADDSYLMLLKVPRNLDRKDARPGMDLYDYVIGLYENYLYILERKADKVTETKISYEEIEGIKVFSNLLLGELTIFLKGKVLKINYNTVSQDIILKTVQIIRNRYANKSFKQIPVLCKNYEEIDIDYLFKNLLREIKTNDKTFSLAAVQQTTKLKTEDNNLGKRILRFITGEKLLNALHLLNEKELLMITRGVLFKKRRDVVYSYEFTYIPLEKLKNISLSKDETYNNLKKLHLKTRNHTFIFYFDENNDQLEKYYENLNNISKVLD